MNLLCIETSGVVCGVTVVRSDAQQFTIELNQPNQHDEHLADLTQKALQEAGLTFQDVDVVAVSSGPGSFTGLRIGAAFVKGLCHTQPSAIPPVRLLPIPTLSSLGESAALSSEKHATIIALIDSHRDLFYKQEFDAMGKPLTEVELVPSSVVVACLKRDELAGNIRDETLVGPGAKRLIGLEIAAGLGANLLDEEFSLLSSRFIASAALERLQRGTAVFVHAQEFVPEYHQAFQARRQDSTGVWQGSDEDGGG